MSSTTASLMVSFTWFLAGVHRNRKW